jgi:hypothetical protein
MLEAWLIGGACAVVCYFAGRRHGDAAACERWSAKLDRVNASARATIRETTREVRAEAIAEAERVREAVSKRSLCGRAIVARLQQLSADAERKQ